MRIPEPFYKLTGQLEGRYQRQWTSGARPVFVPWNKEHNAIFFHMPKTAGTSLLQVLGIETPEGYMTHIPAKTYHWADAEFWEKSYKFTFVRDPADRLVSVFYFMRDKTVWPQQVSWASRHLAGLEFPEFINKLRSNFTYRQIVMSNPFFWPQSDYIRFGRGYAAIDDVFYFENLQSDAERLCKKLGIEWTGMPHERKGDRPSEVTLLDNDAKKLITTLYLRDYYLFRYKLPTLAGKKSMSFQKLSQKFSKT